MNGAWCSLEEVRGLAAVAAEWRQHTGADFEAFKAGFLQKAGRNARSVPCPHKAGCTHEVRPRGRGFVGVCKNDDGTGCDDILLAQEEVEVWEVSLARLGRAIAQALKCDAKDAKLGLDRTRQIASLGDAPLPIVLTVQHDEEGFGDVVAQLVARLPKGFILLAPKSRFCTAPATELLSRVNAGFLSLEAHVTLLASGKLHAPKSGGELFAAYLPEKKEAVKESEATRVFAILQKLRSKRAGMKAPLYDAFVATVLEGLSQRAAAKKCDCSPAQMSKRVGQLSTEFGLPLKQLQDYAKPILEMQTSVKGDRYARKKHGAVQDEPAQYDDGDKPNAREDDAGYLPEDRSDYT